MELRDYQKQIATQGVEILQKFHLLYLGLEVRLGKTLTAFEIARLYGAKNILFITKKNAISSIEKDYDNYSHYYNCTITNKESVHKITGSFDLIILDEAHSFGSYPKASVYAKKVKEIAKNLPIIYLSGTPHPESASQMYHQLWLSSYSIWNKYSNFYKWAKDYVTIKKIYTSYGTANNYSDADSDRIQEELSSIMITYTQKQAGFMSTINENEIEIKMKPSTYSLVSKLIKDRVVQGKTNTIIADTPVKLQSVLHQIFAGTIKLDSGEAIIIDTSIADAIYAKFKGQKIAIFTVFIKEIDMIRQVFGDSITEDFEEFQNSDKSFVGNIFSNSQGVNLSKATALIYLNLPFSGLQYTQSRNRMTTKGRLENTIYFFYAEGGLQKKVLEIVRNKKNYSEKIFQNTYLKYYIG